MLHGLEISPLVDAAGVRLAGEADLATAPRLTDALGDIASDGEVRLDLTELTFMDSSGLGAILAFARSRNGGGPVVIVNPSESITRVFEIAGIERHPKIEIRRTSADQSF